MLIRYQIGDALKKMDMDGDGMISIRELVNIGKVKVGVRSPLLESVVWHRVPRCSSFCCPWSQLSYFSMCVLQDEKKMANMKKYMIVGAVISLLFIAVRCYPPFESAASCPIIRPPLLSLA